jgi:hypothetical protein
MSSNTDINGGTVAPTGQSMIDDILLTAVGSLGQDEILYTNRLKLFPSPNNGDFTVASTESIDYLSVTDLNGKPVLNIEKPSSKQTVKISNAKPGLYILKVRFTGDDRELSTRFVIE